jgi:hypothetical protein
MVNRSKALACVLFHFEIQWPRSIKELLDVRDSSRKTDMHMLAPHKAEMSHYKPIAMFQFMEL